MPSTKRQVSLPDHEDYYKSELEKAQLRRTLSNKNKNKKKTTTTHTSGESGGESIENNNNDDDDNYEGGFSPVPHPRLNELVEESDVIAKEAVSLIDRLQADRKRKTAMAEDECRMKKEKLKVLDEERHIKQDVIWQELEELKDNEGLQLQRMKIAEAVIDDLLGEKKRLSEHLEYARDEVAYTEKNLSENDETLSESRFELGKMESDLETLRKHLDEKVKLCKEMDLMLDENEWKSNLEKSLSSDLRIEQEKRNKSKKKEKNLESSETTESFDARKQVETLLIKKKSQLSLQQGCDEDDSKNNNSDQQQNTNNNTHHNPEETQQEEQRHQHQLHQKDIAIRNLNQKLLYTQSKLQAVSDINDKAAGKYAALRVKYDAVRAILQEFRLSAEETSFYEQNGIMAELEELRNEFRDLHIKHYKTVPPQPREIPLFDPFSASGSVAGRNKSSHNNKSNNNTKSPHQQRTGENHNHDEDEDIENYYLSSQQSLKNNNKREGASQVFQKDIEEGQTQVKELSLQIVNYRSKLSRQQKAMEELEKQAMFAEDLETNGQYRDALKLKSLEAQVKHLVHHAKLQNPEALKERIVNLKTLQTSLQEQVSDLREKLEDAEKHRKVDVETKEFASSVVPADFYDNNKQNNTDQQEKSCDPYEVIQKSWFDLLSQKPSEEGEDYHQQNDDNDENNNNNENADDTTTTFNLTKTNLSSSVSSHRKKKKQQEDREQQHQLQVDFVKTLMRSIEAIQFSSSMEDASSKVLEIASGNAAKTMLDQAVLLSKKKKNAAFISSSGQSTMIMMNNNNNPSLSSKTSNNVSGQSSLRNTMTNKFSNNTMMMSEEEQKQGDSSIAESQQETTATSRTQSPASESLLLNHASNMMILNRKPTKRERKLERLAKLLGIESESDDDEDADENDDNDEDEENIIRTDNDSNNNDERKQKSALLLSSILARFKPQTLEIETQTTRQDIESFLESIETSVAINTDPPPTTSDVSMLTDQPVLKDVGANTIPPRSHTIATSTIDLVKPTANSFTQVIIARRDVRLQVNRQPPKEEFGVQTTILTPTLDANVGTIATELSNQGAQTDDKSVSDFTQQAELFKEKEPPERTGAETQTMPPSLVYEVGCQTSGMLLLEAVHEGMDHTKFELARIPTYKETGGGGKKRKKNNNNNNAKQNNDGAISLPAVNHRETSVTASDDDDDTIPESHRCSSVDERKSLNNTSRTNGFSSSRPGSAAAAALGATIGSIGGGGSGRSILNNHSRPSSADAQIVQQMMMLQTSSSSRRNNTNDKNNTSSSAAINVAPRPYSAGGIISHHPNNHNHSTTSILDGMTMAETHQEEKDHHNRKNNENDRSSSSASNTSSSERDQHDHYMPIENNDDALLLPSLRSTSMTPKQQKINKQIAKRAMSVQERLGRQNVQTKLDNKQTSVFSPNSSSSNNKKNKLRDRFDNAKLDADRMMTMNTTNTKSTKKSFSEYVLEIQQKERNQQQRRQTRAAAAGGDNDDDGKATPDPVFSFMYRMLGSRNNVNGTNAASDRNQQQQQQNNNRLLLQDTLPIPSPNKEEVYFAGWASAAAAREMGLKMLRRSQGKQS